MTLYEKIVSIHPSLTIDDFDKDNGTIVLQCDIDSNMEEYIGAWNHPTLTQPTQEQLDAVTE